MSPIKDFKVTYEAPNKNNSFSPGDAIEGEVTFTLTEETKVKCVSVKAKGDATVHWSEGHGYGTHRYYTSHDSHKNYYKAKEVLVEEKEGETVLPAGDHRYPFKLQIPDENIPPSFKGDYGKITHVLKAKMSRSWHTSTKDKKNLNFVSKTTLPIEQSAQCGSVEKSVGLFGDGKVQMSATVDKGICCPGDTLQITAKVSNKSSEKMKVKVRIDKKIVNRTKRDAKIEEHNLCKMVGEKIAANFEGEVSCSITVPADAEPSIPTGEIINVEHYVKVYLDLTLDTDPEVALPLIIVPRNY